jgi:anti-sigma B factor antagonist
VTICEPDSTEREHRDTIVAVVFGEIDLTCSGRLNARLRELIGRARRLVLDLRDVRFMDISGLHCVLDVHHASRAAGVEFDVVPGPPAVQRLFQVTKTDEMLRFIAACSGA